MTAVGHKQKSAKVVGMSGVGGRADEIRAKADIAAHKTLGRP